jgi:hypothetical protein
MRLRAKGGSSYTRARGRNGRMHRSTPDRGTAFGVAPNGAPSLGRAARFRAGEIG